MQLLKKMRFVGRLLKYSTFLTWFKLEAETAVPGKFIALPQSQKPSGMIAITFSNGIRVEYSGELTEKLLQYLQDA